MIRPPKNSITVCALGVYIDTPIAQLLVKFIFVLKKNNNLNNIYEFFEIALLQVTFIFYYFIFQMIVVIQLKQFHKY